MDFFKSQMPLKFWKAQKGTPSFYDPVSASDLKREKAIIKGHLPLEEGRPQQSLKNLGKGKPVTSAPQLQTRTPLGSFVAASRKGHNELLQDLERQIYSLINIQEKTDGFL